MGTEHLFFCPLFNNCYRNYEIIIYHLFVPEYFLQWSGG